MEIILILFLLLAATLLLRAIILTFRRNWQSAGLSFLGGVIFLLLIQCFVQSHASALRYATCQYQAKKIKELQNQVEEMKHQLSNHTAQVTARKLVEPDR